MKKYILLVFLIPFSTIIGLSQTYLDALRFSYYEYEGTARFSSMGGAFGALGGDATTLSLNPAGIGVYRSSELTFTPTVTYNRLKSEYMSINTIDSRTRLGVSNLGYIGTYLTGQEEGLVNFNFGIVYNKATNYYKSASMKGTPLTNSMMDYFMGKANSNKTYYTPEKLSADDAYYKYPVNSWDIVMSYFNGLIIWNKDAKEFQANISDQDMISQTRYTTQSGSTGEYAFSFGGNISNKLYFGATFGVQDLYYEKVIEYAETAAPNNKSDFKKFRYHEYFNTSGTGYNGKFGVIYRPINQIRLGASIHTPTYFYLIDEYKPKMYSTFGSNDFYDGPKDPNLYDYRIITPLRAAASFAYVFGKQALISIDYEFINYSGMRLKDRNSNFGFEDENNSIKNVMRGTSNLRVGAEGWVSNNIALRAGFAYNQSPDKNYDISKYTYSGGIGYRYESFFADFAYVLTTSKDYYNPYFESPYQISEKESKNRFMLTLGFKF